MAYTEPIWMKTHIFHKKGQIKMTMGRGVLTAVVLLTGVCAGTALADSENGEDGQRVSIHRTNPHNEAVAPPAGSTGTIAPAITNHGGPVMLEPNVYLIWYGNWNQNNGSDTAAGQQIVNDFLFGLSGSNYYKTNASYAGAAPGGFI